MIITRGAEAIIEKKGNFVIKNRIKKGYRIPEIDEKLRKERTKKEMRLMIEAKRNRVNVPTVSAISNTTVKIEYLGKDTVRNILDKLNPEKMEDACNKISENISKLHNANIVHGDLTTSNMVLYNNEVYFIDFGLGEFSQRIEDKAVDLHLLKQALVAKHNKIWERCFGIILETYKNETKNSEQILARLEQIEKRGRYSKK